MNSKHSLVVIVGFLFVAWSQTAKAETSLNVTKLLCEYTSQPNNVDRLKPRFSWLLDSETRGQRQTAYRLVVAKDESALAGENHVLWDTGRVESSQSSHVVYEGEKLSSNSRYVWKVVVWDKEDKPCASEPTQFWTALLDPNDWTAHWIGAGPATEPMPAEGFIINEKKKDHPLASRIRHQGRSLLLRRTIRCGKGIKNARVFVSGLGYYELFLNGEKVGDHVLAPAKTNYRKQVLYDTYDVTDQIKAGPNALGIHLGNGWFNPYKQWWQEYRMQWFGAKRAVLQLHVTYEDGTTSVFQSDESWKYALGPLFYNCIYDGEIYDATRAREGWAKIDYDDSKWRPVELMKPPGGALIAQAMPAIKVTEQIEPVKQWRIARGKVYDMGQNFAGWSKIAVRGEPGTKVVLRFAEDLHENGRIDVTSNEHAKATATYILKGNDLEIYEPRFTFFGFRYVEVTGEPKLPEIAGLKGCVVHTACKTTGLFESGNELINKIHHATVWSQRSNMMGYPLDCPQRDERLGWMGDAQVSAEESMFNMDVPLYWQNWLSGIQSNQASETGDIPIISPRPYIQDEGVEWSSTYLCIVWRHYFHYGDQTLLAEHYPTMKKYLEFLETQAEDHILPAGWIGDWGSLVEGWKEGQPESIPTAFYYHNSVLMSQIATILGKEDDAQQYASLSEDIKTAYNQKYFNAQTGNYNDGSQMANAFPLYLGLVPEEAHEQVLSNLVNDISNKHDGHLTTGVLGSKYLIDALVQSGRPDIAYRLATQTSYPSWGHMVENRTTMSEFWTLKQSHNHVMMGSIDAFFYNTLAGIQVDPHHPGFEKFILKPYIPESLPFARAKIETMRGRIVSAWEQDDDEYRLNIKIPANTTAILYLPAQDSKQVFEDSRPVTETDGVTYVTSSENSLVYSVNSGAYKFVVKKVRHKKPVP